MRKVDRKTYWGIKNALTKKEHELIAFYEVQWRMRHRVPTVEEVSKAIKQTQVSVNYYLQRSAVVTALDARGIPWRQHSQEKLTSTQVATAVTMMNFADTRSQKEKLDQLGVNPSQYMAWLNDPQFRNLQENLADQNIRNIKPTAITEFTRLINQGDWNAIKYYLDTTGAIRASEAPQSEQLMGILIEIIMRHVKDPAVMSAIAADIKAVTGNRTAGTEFIDAEATPVDSQELAQARKALGV